MLVVKESEQRGGRRDASSSLDLERRMKAFLRYMPDDSAGKRIPELHLRRPWPSQEYNLSFIRTTCAWILF